MKRSKPIVALCLLLVAAVWLLRLKSGTSTPAMPLDQLQGSSNRADERRCAECHDQPDQFYETGHAQALTRASSPESLALLSLLDESPGAREERTRFEPHSGEPYVANSSQGRNTSVRLDWCFGSGRHARTWVATMGDSTGATDLLEFRWTWYRHAGGFDVTPGQPQQPSATHLGPLGLFYDHPKTRRCFSCHASWLPIDDGRLRFEEIVPGVTCQRCHGPRGEHVATEGKVREGFWRTATPLEAVNRCAQCHRRPEEVEVDGIDKDDPSLARFQPIGLLESECFKRSKTMTCTTCHDPHRPLEAQDSLGIWQCVQCHDAQKKDHVTCGAGEIDDCLRCHMPKVRADAPLFFTDHWIRVR